MQHLSKRIGSRRKGRILALNILYLVDIANIDVNEAISYIFDQKHKYDNQIGKFSSFLVIATLQNLSIIDEIIKKYLKNWTIERLSAIDRNILRLATCEFLYCPETPISVIINEAIEIAKEFSTKDSGRFVNGLLDKIKDIRDKEFKN